jgi:integrase
MFPGQAPGVPASRESWRRRVFVPAGLAAGWPVTRRRNGRVALKWGIHIYRRCAAKYLVTKGAGLIDIARRFGHTTIACLETYVSDALGAAEDDPAGDDRANVGDDGDERDDG